MPEPISSIASGKILENYRRITSWGTRSPSGSGGARHPAPVSDTVRISQEARDKLRLAEQAQRNEQIRREEVRREQDEALKRSLEVLELRTGAPPEVIKNAYHHLLRNYHPDKYSHLPPEFRKLAESKAQQIIEAYGKLTK
jgi:DnaJ-domain-containing protein 1